MCFLVALHLKLESNKTSELLSKKMSMIFLNETKSICSQNQRYLDQVLTGCCLGETKSLSMPIICIWTKHQVSQHWFRHKVYKKDIFNSTYLNSTLYLHFFVFLLLLWIISDFSLVACTTDNVQKRRKRKETQKNCWIIQKEKENF